ncbi:MAG TPA: RNA polymerase sigma factor [Steroidobacteraceae bacterium]|jgi:RNA polymerase sigma-70 factor (ECF subfamily)
MTEAQIGHSPDAGGDDLGLARRIAGGDRVAFEILMRRYNRRLYRLARATLHNQAEAQDALQEAYLRAYRSIEQFRGEAALSTWLTRLVLNECLGRLRRDARRHNVVPIVRSNTEIAMAATPAPECEEPERSVGVAQMRALLERKLDELPEHFRTVFVLRSVEELSVEETAQCLEIPPETVRTRHFRAKSLLRESLAQEIDLAERDVFEFGGEHCDRTVATVLERLGRT